MDTKHSATEAQDATLLQTSALRLSAEALAADPRNERSLEDVVRAGRALQGALRRPGLEVLLDGGDLLEKMALLGRTLSTDDLEAATDVFRSLNRAVGILEQSLDAVLAGAAPEQLEDYGDAMLEAFSARWRPYIEPQEDDAESDPSVDAPTGAAVVAAEPSVATAFLVEVLDRLAVCEEAALDWRDADAARGALPSIEDSLETIEEAFAAVGLRARPLAETRRLLSSVRQGAEPFEPKALAELLLETFDWARGQAARACDLNAFATDLVPDAGPERLRARATEADGDEGTVEVERLLRRLRRPLRAAATACGCWADLDGASPALRLDRVVAERVARALSVLLRSGFDGRGEAARPGEPRVLRVRVESWEPTSLVVVVDEAGSAADAGAAGEHDGNGKPEALHGIDVTREPTPEDWERLVYRKGFANVVVMVVPEGSLAAAGAPP